MTSRGVERSSYYGKGDDLRAPGIWEPGRALGDLPPPGRGQSAAAPRRGFATHWRRIRYRREQAGGGGE